MTIKFGKTLTDRQHRKIERLHREWIRNEVMPGVKRGLSFDDAWIAAGGEVYTDAELALAGSGVRGGHHNA